MYHSHLIQSILPTDKVLEIGPGGNPYYRSDVFLELEYESEDEKIAQRAYQEELQTNKKIVYYKGNRFPFADKEFDYVICSHVLEHVEDVELFVSEVFRVAKKGYFEFPTFYYDYIYKIPFHVNVLLKKSDGLYWMKQDSIHMETFDTIREFYHKATFNNYWAEGYAKLWFQGFEWHEPFPCKQKNTLQDLVYSIEELDTILPRKEKNKLITYDVYYKSESKGFKNILRKLHFKLGLLLQ